ncbi:MAG: tRNA 4-thiouridine(8) synthase ThiI [Chloroflexi bacterium]|nr:tRNA 4-thiouridine(8) synthase ThiI [Chloroflexota bacterium]
MQQPRDVLVRFHEIGLKGKNQPMFVRRLVENLERATAGLGVERVWATRMLVRMRLAPEADWESVRARTATVFGAVKFSLAARTEPEYGTISALLSETAQARSFSTFRISANRTDKTFPLTSHDLNVRLGDEIREASGARVDLSHPEADFRVEVGRDDAFVYTDDQRGAGGLPVGTGGRVAVMMSGGIDSPVAAWRMMRRGCKAVLVHFHSFPLVEGRSRDKAKELAESLNGWQYDTRLHLVPFADVQRRVILEVPGPLRVIAYRRFMVRIAEAIGVREGAQALVTGESLGQVGSQTLRNIATVDEAASMPILRPLVGMDKSEIIAQAEAIGTFETSIQPDEDCCTLFVPRSPATAVRPEQIAEHEAQLDVAALVAEATGAAEVFEYHAPVVSE